MKTRDALGILWPDPLAGMAEVSGISFFGLFCDDRIPIAAAETAETWAEFGFETRASELPWEIWPGFELDVRIKSWPSDEVWMNLVESTLRNLVDHGAFVAWCGGELCFTTPAAFEDAGFVYAACSKHVNFICNAGLSDEWEALTAPQSANLHRDVVETFPDRWRQEIQSREEWQRENEADSLE